MRKWHKSIFLSLLDLTLTNSYILYNMAHLKGSPLYLDKGGYLYHNAIAEGLLLSKSYEMELHKSIRASIPAFIARRSCLSPCAHNRTSNFIVLISTSHGHPIRTCEPKRRRRSGRNSRDTARVNENYDSDGKVIMRGYSGRDYRFRRCIVCATYRNDKGSTSTPTYTKYYCSVCQVAICGTSRLIGEGWICWNEIYESEIFVKKITRKQTKSAIHRPSWTYSFTGLKTLNSVARVDK